MVAFGVLVAGALAVGALDIVAVTAAEIFLRVVGEETIPGSSVNVVVLVTESERVTVGGFSAPMLDVALAGLSCVTSGGVAVGACSFCVWDKVVGACSFCAATGACSMANQQSICLVWASDKNGVCF